MIFGSKKEDGASKEKIEKLEKQNRIMRSTLEFYADVKNWEEGHKYRDEDNATIFTCTPSAPCGPTSLIV